MTNSLPYIFLDNDFNLNLALLILVLDEHGVSARGKNALDFDRLQVFLYLIKNPSKINLVLLAAGKKETTIEALHTYTIESRSSNVDILFKREKTKILIKSAASYGFLAVERLDDGALMYFLSGDGEKICSELTGAHFDSVRRLILALKPLLSVPTSKLFSILSGIFKGF
jgi:hypothetical protein